jgi:FlaA1/EpsC-like NDP-sugar epimerase
MTRFMITLEQGVSLVWHAFEDSEGGEIYVKKIPSMNIIDIAKAVAPGVKYEVTGIRPGEKLHEQMIGIEDALCTYEYEDYYKILPMLYNWKDDPSRIKNGKKVSDSFTYNSKDNPEWMTSEMLRSWIKSNTNILGKI